MSSGFFNQHRELGQRLAQSSINHKLKAKVDETQYRELTKNLKEAKLKIKTSEIIGDREIADTFECMICMSIPIAPKECNLCDTLFCLECLEDHQAKTCHSNKDKCPKCK